MREIVHIQIGQCGNQIGAKVRRAPFSCWLHLGPRGPARTPHVGRADKSRAGRTHLPGIYEMTPLTKESKLKGLV